MSERDVAERIAEAMSWMESDEEESAPPPRTECPECGERAFLNHRYCRSCGHYEEVEEEESP